MRRAGILAGKLGASDSERVEAKAVFVCFLSGQTLFSEREKSEMIE